MAHIEIFREFPDFPVTTSPGIVEILGDNKTLLSEAAGDELEVRVHELIDDATRRVIMRIGGKEALDVLLRFGLTEALVTNEDLVWGQVRAGRLVPTLDRYFDAPLASKFTMRSCEALFQPSQPVR